MYKLVIADDENIIRRGIADTLKRGMDSFEIYEAGNGEEVLQILECEKIDAMILDIKMPKMNGIAVMKYVFEKKLDIVSVVLTGYDEFDYAKSALEYGAMKYVLKPLIPSKCLEMAKEIEKVLNEKFSKASELSMLKDEFEKNRQMQKDKLFQDILKGDYTEEGIKERCELLKIRMQGPFYQIALLKVKQYGKTALAGENCLMDYSINIFLQKYVENNENTEFFQINSNKYILLFDLENEEKQELIEYLYKMKDAVEEAFGCVCVIGVGNICSCIGDIKYSYSSAEFVMRYLNVQQLECIVTADEIKDKEKRKEFVFDLEEYGAALGTAKVDQALQNIKSLFQQAADCANESELQEFYIIINQIILATYRTILQLGGDMKDMGITELVAMQKVSQLDTLDDIRKYLLDFISKAGEVIKETNLDDSNSTIKKIKNIVKEEYSQQLSMKYIADKMYLNHIYLGQLFKKETGLSLNDYINKVRINKAKKLLKETGAMVYEIADQVGFSDSQYFSTVFKKIVGVSPKEYRDM